MRILLDVCVRMSLVSVMFENCQVLSSVISVFTYLLQIEKAIYLLEPGQVTVHNCQLSSALHNFVSTYSFLQTKKSLLAQLTRSFNNDNSPSPLSLPHPQQQQSIMVNKHFFATLLIWCCHHMVTSLVPDEETLLRQQQSGLRVVDWPSVSRVVLNQRVQTNDPRGECCTTNYSAVWDLDEELIAFVADNLFCNTTVETLTESVLAPWREWETNTQVMNRVHRHGKDKSERYYSGNFPGVTSIIRDPMDVMLMLRRCFQPFLSTLLDSEQMYVVRAGVEQNLIEKQNHRDDAIDPVESILLSDDEEVYDSEEEEIDVSGDEVASGFAVLNNPILPKYKSSFWASVSLPPENITHMHSAPHTDGAHPGRASVYTLSKNKSYHATATTFNRMRVSELTILNTQTLQQNHGGEVQKVQEEKIEAGESPLSGWLNTTTNRFSDVLAMAYNAHNRFTMYPSNRLHTAFIPDAKLLHSDPAIGRLSLNTFWETYLPKEDRNFCTEVTANAARTLFDKIPSVVPLTAEEVLGLCRGCSAWPNYCGWCAATMSCNSHGESFRPNAVTHQLWFRLQFGLQFSKDRLP
mgnify:CR=1 FL=1